MCGQYARRGRHARSVRSPAAEVRPDERRRLSREAAVHREAYEAYLRGCCRRTEATCRTDPLTIDIEIV